MRRASVFVRGCLCLLGSPLLSASASTLWVDANAPSGGDGTPTSPFRSVQDAIDAALGGDEIRVLPGTYHESIDFQSKSIAVIGVGGPGATTLRGNQDGPVAFLRGGWPVLDGFTVENGSGGFVPGIWVPCGGGILIHGASYAVVANCIVRGNYAARGDGVAVVNAAGVMHSSVIELNGGYADPSYCNIEDWGGGVLGHSSQFWISYSTIRNNRTTTDGGGAVGVSLDHCTIEGNTSAYGAGISGCYAVDCTIRQNSARSCDASDAWAGGADGSTLLRCTLSQNYADFSAGGARNSVLRECLIRGNAANPWEGLGRGGGLQSCTLEDCLVEGNRIFASAGGPPGYGGGAWGGSALRTVFRGNRADIAGGVFGTTLDRCAVVESGGVGALGAAITNSIVRDNAGGDVDPSCSVQYSNIGGGSPGVGNLDACPLFWDAPGGDFHLQLHSPCIDSGDPAQLDPDGSRVDMGAFPFRRDECLPTVPIGACAAGPSSNGCTPTLTTTGSPSLSLSQGFVIGSSQLPAQRSALVLYGTSCGIEQPWATSTRCVGSPVQRTLALSTGGSPGACDGSLGLDFHVWRTTQPHALGVPFHPGDAVWVQVWYRDPGSPLGSNFSPGLRFLCCP